MAFELLSENFLLKLSTLSVFIKKKKLSSDKIKATCKNNNGTPKDHFLEMVRNQELSFTHPVLHTRLVFEGEEAVRQFAPESQLGDN